MGREDRESGVRSPEVGENATGGNREPRTEEKFKGLRFNSWGRENGFQTFNKFQRVQRLERKARKLIMGRRKRDFPG